jgi:hypothetical protein
LCEDSEAGQPDVRKETVQAKPSTADRPCSIGTLNETKIDLMQ